MDAAGFDVSQGLGELRIDDASLLGRVLIVRGPEFRTDADHAPETSNSISWPLLRPACRRTAGGTTSGALLLTVAVMEVHSTCDLASV